jgi:hypothetical protein
MNLLWTTVIAIVTFTMGTFIGANYVEQTCENRIDAIYQSHGLNDD